MYGTTLTDYRTILTVISGILEVKTAKCTFALQKPCSNLQLKYFPGVIRVCVYTIYFKVDKKRWTTRVTNHFTASPYLQNTRKTAQSGLRNYSLQSQLQHMAVLKCIITATMYNS